MSSIIFALDETQAFVATDTLATKQNGKPIFFTSKAFYLSHLRLLIAGTGVAGFLDSWLLTVNYALRARDVNDLNEQARDNMQSLWAKWKKGFPRSSDVNTTIYHFGFSETSGLVHAFAYRSENDFEPNTLSRGIHVKPACTVPNGYQLPRDIRGMMEEQRIIQLTLPKADRVYIGGEIQCHHLMQDGYNTFTQGHFDDYQKDADLIFAK